MAMVCLQRRVTRQWNGNFVIFQAIFLKNLTKDPMKRYIYFYGKWEIRITDFTAVWEGGFHMANFLQKSKLWKKSQC